MSTPKYSTQAGIRQTQTMQQSLEATGNRFDSEYQVFRSNQDNQALQKNFEVTGDPTVAEMSVATTLNAASVKAMFRIVKEKIEMANNSVIQYKRDIQ